MNRFARTLALALALLGPLTITLITGCSTPQTAEVTAYRGIKAADVAVEAAIRAWAEGFVRREADNEKTRASDPGGYLERRSELLKEQGRVVELRGRYSAAVTLAVETWIRAKQGGAQSPPEPAVTAEVLSLQRQIESLSR